MGCFYISIPTRQLPGLDKVKLPSLTRVKLRQPDSLSLVDPEEKVAQALSSSKRIAGLAAGSSVGLAVGSRGISDLVAVVRSASDWLKIKGFKPFILPAMGSHGGGTARGQTQVLNELGIKEETVGAPIISSMDVVEYGRTFHGVPCFFDAEASMMDAVIVINRVKPHTSFHREIESGLTKLIAVGLGNRKGAMSVHQLGPKGLSEVLPEIAAISLKNSPIVFGLALVENSHHELMIVEGTEPEDLMETDRRLLRVARNNMPRLPFKQMDVLVVQKIGKEISGMGMDYAVTGRTDIRSVANSGPLVVKLGALDLTPASKGNAVGLGVADYVSRKLAEKIDMRKVYVNAFTSRNVEKGRLPMVLPSDRDVFLACVASCWRLPEETPRFCLIKSTLHLDEVIVSEPLLAELKTEDKIAQSSIDLLFKDNGELISPW